MRFYLGTHQPSWLAQDLDIPLLVSHRRLVGRRSFPRASGPWALDSGGFTELSLHGRWRTAVSSYVAAVRRYATEIGNMDWAAPQDWMCEPAVLRRTGLSVRGHQRHTVSNYLRLREVGSDLRIIPVLQGWSVEDYLRCADLYERAGVDLAAQPVVGIGSVCRRQSSLRVQEIILALAMRNLKLHGFGIKTGGLRHYADAVASSDSMAWSKRGRYVKGCTASHRTESNCLSFALRWREQLLHALDGPLLSVDSEPTASSSRNRGGDRS